MASGNAIDEQYKETWKRKPRTYEQTVRPIAQTWSRPDDEDYDPNDINPAHLQSLAQRPRVTAGPSGLRPPMDSSDDDDDF